jgi:predicted membrane protein
MEPGSGGGGGMHFTHTVCVFHIILTIYFLLYYIYYYIIHIYYILFLAKNTEKLDRKGKNLQHDMQTTKMNRADNKRQSQLSSFRRFGKMAKNDYYLRHK